MGLYCHNLSIADGLHRAEGDGGAAILGTCFGSLTVLLMGGTSTKRVCNKELTQMVISSAYNFDEHYTKSISLALRCPVFVSLNRG